MKPTGKLFLLLLILLPGCSRDRYQIHYQKVDNKLLNYYPELLSEIPDLPSPAMTDNGREVVLAKLQDSVYAWFDATVENGDTFDYKKNLYGKGNQLLADEADFPTLARKGIHSDWELANTKTITGRSISHITVDGRPGRSSGAGFMAANETILSVIWQDNQTVKKMGLTHPDMARPLFHLWNGNWVNFREKENNTIDEKMDITSLVYNGHEVTVQGTGSRGWQESIFDDEILGSGHIELQRELTVEELEFLKAEYEQLAPDSSKR